MRFRGLAVLAVVAAILGRGADVAAGPLDPPAGPVSATGPTMIYSLPYTISSPGLYKLGRSLTSPGPFVGIFVNASNVTIDLAGHSIDGVTSVNSTFAFMCGSGVGNIAILDGRIANWKGVIECAGSVRMENVRVHNCGSASLPPYSLVSGGSSSRLVDCVFIDNVMTDAVLGAGSTVQRYSSKSVGEGTSLVVGDRSNVLDCAVEYGSIAAGKGCLVSRCTVRPNFGPGPTGPVRGITVNNGSTVSLCVVSGDLRTGISAGADCVVSECTVSGDVVPVYAPGEFGIAAGLGSIIRDCKVTVTAAGSRGIGAPPKGVVRGCTVSAAGAGIVSTGEGATIDSNAITGALTGIALDGTGNRVMRNSIRGATNAVTAVAGNDVAPVGTAATATSPWANLVN
jgi:hypothetical protein